MWKISLYYGDQIKSITEILILTLDWKKCIKFLLYTTVECCNVSVLGYVLRGQLLCLIWYEKQALVWITILDQRLLSIVLSQLLKLELQKSSSGIDGTQWIAITDWFYYLCTFWRSFFLVILLIIFPSSWSKNQTSVNAIHDSGMSAFLLLKLVKKLKKV